MQRQSGSAVLKKVKPGSDSGREKVTQGAKGVLMGESRRG